MLNILEIPKKQELNAIRQVLKLCGEKTDK